MFSHTSVVGMMSITLRGDDGGNRVGDEGREVSRETATPIAGDQANKD